MAHGRLFALACIAVLLVSAMMPLSRADDGQEDYAMFVGVDETKVSIISGNLTLAITHDSWPRLLFWHTSDPFSPTFDMGFPRLHLFNDTDGDGRFCPSEAVYTIHLDSNHVKWNLSPVEPGFASDLGVFVLFSMSATVDAYNQTLDAPPAIRSWADVEFWFRVAENDVSYTNPVGSHVVSGKTEVFVNTSVEVRNGTGLEYLVVERSLQGGASANMIHICEDGPGTEPSIVLSARDDDTLQGDCFTRPLNGTESPVQSVEIAQEDGTVQAFYHWGSVAGDLSNPQGEITFNTSCYTTGAGLMLDSALRLSNGTVAFSLDSSVGIQEDGFVGSVTDWLKQFMGALIVASIVVAVVSVVALHVVLRRRRLRHEAEKDKDSNEPR